MGAVLKLYDDQPEYNKPTRMKIPLQSEIAIFIEEKMNWPPEFCTHYANKFWNHYQAQGWKLSNGNTMKDWKAAFNSQWQVIRFDDDKNKLKEIQSKDIRYMDRPAAIKYLDTILMAYSRGIKPDRPSALKLYDYIKGLGIIKFSPEVIAEIRARSNNNTEMAKLHSLKYIFDNMIAQNVKFSTFH